uniref:Uncharacterized protein n=1 Tax=Oryza meridionalis TaxID=40149 RepID=A0A0E0D4B8_9ORYZ
MVPIVSRGGGGRAMWAKDQKDRGRWHNCKECVVDCDEALRRRRATRSEEKLAADALFLKAMTLLNLAVCAADHEPVIMALEGSLKLCPGSKEMQAKLDMAKRNRDVFAEQERLDQEAAKTHRNKDRQ